MLDSFLSGIFQGKVLLGCQQLPTALTFGFSQQVPATPHVHMCSCMCDRACVYMSGLELFVVFCLVEVFFIKACACRLLSSVYHFLINFDSIADQLNRYSPNYCLCWSHMHHWIWCRSSMCRIDLWHKDIVELYLLVQ